VVGSVLEAVDGSDKDKKTSSRPEHSRRSSGEQRVSAGTSSGSKYWNKDDDDKTRAELEQARYLKVEEREHYGLFKRLNWEEESDQNILSTAGRALDELPCVSCKKRYDKDYYTTRRVLTVGFVGEETETYLEACCREVSPTGSRLSHISLVTPWNSNADTHEQLQCSTALKLEKTDIRADTKSFRVKTDYA
jgi:hypothetical protein